MDDLDITIGNPDDQLNYWEHQGQMDNCAVVAEMSIINQFGHDLTQDEANFISAENGWYNPGGGTSPDVIGNMMDLYDIPNHTNYDATINDLAQELQSGHGVIVGVNSDELWDSGPLADLKNFICDLLGIDQSTFIGADHAVVVTGIDTSDPSNPMVVINDSGVSDGAANMYPLDQFMDAWENSDFYYTATDIPLGDSNAGDLIDWSQWSVSDIAEGVAGVAVGATTFCTTGEPLISLQAGLAASTLVENYFEDPNAILNI